MLIFRRRPLSPETSAEEDALGLSRAYLVAFPAEALINWSRDAHGNFEWVILRSAYYRKADPNTDMPVREIIWRYYDREHYQIWRQHSDTDLSGFGADAEDRSMELVSKGVHALAKQRQVPLFDLEVSDGLWLMNKAGSLQLEHFNKSNALSWALNIGLFATPVVYSERDWNQIIGESYYIQLGANDRFGWTEPEGRVYEIAAQNLSRLQEEIYRVCYLMNQGVGQRFQCYRPVGSQQTSRFRDYTRSFKGLRRCRQGLYEADTTRR